MVMGKLTVRTAEPADSAAVVDIHVRARRSYYEGFLPEADLAGWADSVRATGYAELFDRPNRVWLCAELDGQVVGFALVTTGAAPELLQIHVDPDRWRAGVGEALHDACVEVWRQDGARAAHLEVFEPNARARAFYAKLGWHEVERAEAGDPPHVRLKLPVSDLR